jgi:hypothetical protein
VKTVPASILGWAAVQILQALTRRDHSAILADLSIGLTHTWIRCIPTITYRLNAIGDDPEVDNFGKGPRFETVSLFAHLVFDQHEMSWVLEAVPVSLLYQISHTSDCGTFVMGFDCQAVRFGI